MNFAGLIEWNKLIPRYCCISVENQMIVDNFYFDQVRLIFTRKVVDFMEFLFAHKRVTVIAKPARQTPRITFFHLFLVSPDFFLIFLFIPVDNKATLFHCQNLVNPERTQKKTSLHHEKCSLLLEIKYFVFRMHELGVARYRAFRTRLEALPIKCNWGRLETSFPKCWTNRSPARRRVWSTTSWWASSYSSSRASSTSTPTWRDSRARCEVSSVPPTSGIGLNAAAPCPPQMITPFPRPSGWVLNLCFFFYR